MLEPHQDYLDVAEQLARRAGSIAREHLGGRREVRKKGQIDLVTEIDIECEEMILGGLSARFPDHDIISEEAGDKDIVSDYRWLVDPLDGTTNYAHGYPVFAVSIGLEYAGRMEVGVVCDPVLDEMFTAMRGSGARLNDRPIRVSDTPTLNDSLLATGFPYSIREDPGLILEYFFAFSLRTQGVRRLGSAALDLCAVASGRMDGFWELGLKPWDTAAAALIVEEAGGRLSALNGEDFSVHRPEVVAGNDRIHGQMLEVIAEVGV